MQAASLQELESAPAERILEWGIASFGRELALSTSFQKGGMVLLDMAARISPAVRVLTFDTGRLPEETYRMIETVRERYGLRVEIVLPDASEVEAMVTLHGPNLFYQGVPQRTLCCQIRKVRPFDRQMRGLKAWVTGLRREQNESRAAVRKIEETGGRVKLNPLADWSGGQVEAYTREHGVPVHPLYAKGYGSIGCGPCTRALSPGEPQRAGRWWWEQEAAKECGIHFSPEGKAERGASSVDVLLQEVLAARRG
jgi:phosphoadenosine phosphosulfate reductase